MTIVRKAELSDIPMLMSLGQQMIQESPVFKQLTPDLDKQKLVLEKAVISAQVCVYILEDLTGFFIGHLESYPWFKETYACEDVFFVLPEYRGTTRAVRLLKAFESWCTTQKITHIKIGISTNVELERTKKFYRGMGFYQTDTIIFAKEI